MCVAGPRMGKKVNVENGEGDKRWSMSLCSGMINVVKINRHSKN